MAYKGPEWDLTALIENLENAFQEIKRKNKFYIRFLMDIFFPYKLKDKRGFRSPSELLDSVPKPLHETRDFYMSPFWKKLEVPHSLRDIGFGHPISTGLVIVAVLVGRWNRVSTNREECLDLLEKMYKLALWLAQVMEPALAKSSEGDKKMLAIIEKSVASIEKGFEFCIYFADCYTISRMWNASDHKARFTELNNELDTRLEDLKTQLLISIYARGSANSRMTVSINTYGYYNFHMPVSKLMVTAVILAVINITLVTYFMQEGMKPRAMVLLGPESCASDYFGIWSLVRDMILYVLHSCSVVTIGFWSLSQLIMAPVLQLCSSAIFVFVAFCPWLIKLLFYFLLIVVFGIVVGSVVAYLLLLFVAEFIKHLSRRISP